MRIKQVHISLALVLAGVSFASGQGTFQNLNFEEANIVPILGLPYAVTVANALPAWTVDYGNLQQTLIHYNDPSLGNGTSVSLIANGYPTAYGGSPIDGNYSVLLQGGLNIFFQPAAATISQTGLIPAGTQSLLFASLGQIPLNAPPEVFIGSDQLTLFPVSGNGGIYFGANISAWAGQTEQLSFSVPTGNTDLLDDISFSPTAVTPEPDSLVLMGMGGALFAAYRCLMESRK